MTFNKFIKMISGDGAPYQESDPNITRFLTQE
jgi:hypothetical protein